ncbi:MAG: nuclear transport factor 2 family protein [Candidatus Odyssella sp.]|nr:nuclear transport factor 2 family protein [Candidatus Odyssella sp.]
MPDTTPDPLVLARDVVRAYLDTMEARDLERAKRFLAPGFVMTFPGNQRFTELEALVAWSRPRYRWVKKRYDRFDAAPGPTGTHVYCFGTLYGEWNDGAAFDGIRFIDRFTVRAGKLVDQMVWNDMGEAARANERKA